MLSIKRRPLLEDVVVENVTGIASILVVNHKVARVKLRGLTCHTY